MTARHPEGALGSPGRVVVGGLWALGLAAALTGGTLDALRGANTVTSIGNVVLQYLPLATIAALLVVRRPRNAVAWLLANAAFFAFGIASFSSGWLHYSASPRGDVLPLVSWVVPLELVAFPLGFVPLLTLLLLWFPTGRPPTPRWRVATVLAVSSTALTTVGQLFKPGPVNNSTYGERFANPFGVTSLEGVLSLMSVAGLLLIAPATALGLAAFILRWRRAVDEERAQLRWMLFALLSLVTFTIGNAIAFAVLGDSDTLSFVTTALGNLMISVLLPACLAVSILRYRLYDIDRLVSRTVTYGVLTVLVVLPYLLIVTVVTSFASSDLAVALATLAAAALFAPARRRVQARVDRRFNRARYDAAQTVEAFSARLRDEVDLDELTGDLLSVVDRTVQPAHASLWLRAGSA